MFLSEAAEAVKRWAHWEAVLDGKRGKDNLLRHLLQDPGEYELRRLLRTFDHRDELFARLGDFLWVPQLPLDPDDVKRLAEETAAAWLSVPDTGLEIANFDLATSEERPDIDELDLITEPLSHHLFELLPSIHAGDSLLAVVEGACSDNWVAMHVLQPLVPLGLDLSSYVQLRKSEREVWVDKKTLFVSQPTPNRFIQRIGWPPKRAWPSEQEIKEHCADERPGAKPKTGKAKLAALLDSPSSIAVSAAAWHPNLPEAAILKVVGHESSDVRTAISRKRATPPDILLSMASDPHPRVRLGVTYNESSPVEAIALLADDPDVNVFGGAARNRHCPPHARDRAMTHPNYSVRCGLAENPTITGSTAEHLSRDPHSYVRYRIARNPNTPVEVLKQLMQDPERGVAIRATETIEALEQQLTGQEQT